MLRTWANWVLKELKNTGLDSKMLKSLISAYLVAEVFAGTDRDFKKITRAYLDTNKITCALWVSKTQMILKMQIVFFVAQNDSVGLLFKNDL